MSGPQPLTERGRKHGRPTSWAVVGVAVAAFAGGGAAMILGMWVLVFVCAGVFVLSGPVGLRLGIMDDTVEWLLPTDAQEHRHRVDEAHGPT